MPQLTHSLRRLTVGLALCLAAFSTACTTAVTVTPDPDRVLPAPVVQIATITPQPTQVVTTTPVHTITPLPTFTPAVSPTAAVTAEAATVIVTGNAPTGGDASASTTVGPTALPAATSSGPVAASPTSPPLPTATVATGGGVGFHTYGSPVIVANYMPWYNPDSWSSGCTSDSPASGAYQSSDPATISRHISEARAAGLDGFAVHWGGPGDLTDANLKQILGQGFGATVTFLNHFFYGTASRASVTSSLQTVVGYANTYGSWIRYAGKPVIFFADMGRIDTSGGLTPQQAWAEVRNAVDPNRNTIWIAEGLDPSYLQVFDGLYIYRIDHACCPSAYANAGRWSGWVRDAERLYGPRYFVGTIQPGWDDSRTIDPACNGVRLSAEPFARNREGGAYYDRTFNAVIATAPDMIVVHSFNEWVEGSFIEPSTVFGNFYIEKTAQFAAQFKSSR